MSDAEPRWMTYRELADELGISHRAAEARARRQVRAGRWRHRNDNDALKTARVLVPPADLDSMRQDTAGDTPPGTQGDTVPGAPRDMEGGTDPHGISLLLDALKASHERELAARDELMSELRKRAEIAEADLQTARERRDKAETLRDAAQAIRDEAQATVNQLRAALAVAEAEPGIAKALRQGRAMLAGWIGGRKA
jgi:hypothetical protein